VESAINGSRAQALPRGVAGAITSLVAGAELGSMELMDTPGPRSVGGTFGGNPVVSEIAFAVLDIIEETPAQVTAVQ
jgi:4-aminobutyrate aminotransferase-like enzyme